MLNYPFLREQVPPPGGAVDLAWTWKAFPTLQALSGAAQDARHHGEGDLWMHTTLVVAEMVHGADYASSTEDERFVLFYAALLHDMAKPEVAQVDPMTGSLEHPAHARRSAIDARIALWKAAVPFALREAICRLIAMHPIPVRAMIDHQSGQSIEYLVRKLSNEMDLRLLAALADANMRGSVTPKQAQYLVDIQLFREIAIDDGCFGTPRAFADDITRMAYLRGAEISPDFPLQHEYGARVIVMCGLPASGKNTWVAKHCRHMPVVSFDDARAEMGLKHGENEAAVAARVMETARSLLRAQAPFVWNSTHLSATMRARTVDLLYSYNAQVEIVYVEQTADLVFKRGNRRDAATRNAAIEKMLYRWEVPLPTEAHHVRYLVTQAAPKAAAKE